MTRNLFLNSFYYCGQLGLLPESLGLSPFRAIIERVITTSCRYSYSTQRILTMSQDNKRVSCIFCKICDDTSKEGLDKLLYSNDEIVVFRDIYPAAKHHYLVVPREHILTPKSLTKDQKPFVEQMIAIAKQTLEKEGADMSDIRLGFHWPPFHSIKHLHLHAISPTKDMSFIKRLIFRENSWWFVPCDYVLNRLSSL